MCGHVTSVVALGQNILERTTLTRHAPWFFKNYGKMLKVPFVFYADFESYLESIQGVSNDPNKSSSDIFQLHKPASFCLYRVCENQQYNKMYTYDIDSNDIVFVN